MYIDAHCHMDLPAFEDDLGAVVERAREDNISRFVLAGIDAVGWPRQRRLCGRYSGFSWTAGVHPVAASKLSLPDALAQLERLPDCFEGDHCAIGVGEMGLDSVFAGVETLDVQERVFRDQLKFARDTNRPIVLHAVGCHGRVLDRLRKDGLPASGGMIHSFSGAPGLAQAYLGLGLHISVSGRALNPRSRKLRATISMVPMHRLLLESDAPDQAPVKGARNEPTVLLQLGKRIAEIRGCKPDDILRDSARNCMALFGLKPSLEGRPDDEV